MDHVMRMHSAPTLKAAINVNARRDSRAMDTPSVQMSMSVPCWIMHVTGMQNVLTLWAATSATAMLDTLEMGTRVLLQSVLESVALVTGRTVFVQKMKRRQAFTDAHACLDSEKKQATAQTLTNVKKDHTPALTTLFAVTLWDTISV
jgi:hypothetical protein